MDNIKNIQDRFVTYKNTENDVWIDRLTWKGLYGDTPKVTTSIIKFAKANGFDNFQLSNNSMSLKKEVDKFAKKYVSWVKSVNDTYNEEEYNDMYRFFIGALGEYFFFKILEDVKCVTAPNLKDGKIGRYDFNYVAPRLKGENDYGVDFTGVVSHGMNTASCVIQVKFWNPYSDNPREFTNHMAQSVHSDAICNEFIDNAENENIIVCWLGDTKNVSRYLKANKHLYKHLVFIDSYALDCTVNGQNSIFWQRLHDSIIHDIKNIKKG